MKPIWFIVLTVCSVPFFLKASQNEAGEVSSLGPHISSLAFFLIVGAILLYYLLYRKSRAGLEVLTKLNENINQQKLAVEAADLEKDRILNVVAHDLRSPLGMISYLADLTLMEEGVNESVKKSLAAIKQTSVYALSLIDELLVLEETDEHHHPKDLVEMNKLVESSIGMLYSTAAEKNQTIVFNPFGSSLNIMVNSDQITRAINKVINNAIKFSMPDTAITVSLYEERGYATIEVRDEGIGIPETMFKDVFELFTAARRRGTSGERSYGMGLFISKKIVEAHGGSIRFESIRDEGSTFYISIPLTNNIEAGF